MMYTYTLPITAFKNDKIASAVFQGEIEALDLQSAAFDAIATHEHDDGTDVNVIFSAEPDAADKSAVDAAAAAHEGEDEAEMALVDLLTDSDKGRDVQGVDYKTGLATRLHKVVANMHRGEVREVDYYADETETDLVLSVKVYADEDLTTLGYSRTQLGTPVERWTSRIWYRKDGSPGAEKVTHKIYTHDPVSQMHEGMRRRTNVVDKLAIDAISALIATTAANPASPTEAEVAAAYDAVTEYWARYEAGMTTFVRVARHDFTTPPASPNITDDTDEWLDNSVEAMGYPTGWTIRTIILESVKNISE